MALHPPTRRGFMKAAAAGVGGVLCGADAPPRMPGGQNPGPPEVSPAEDLMREHGLLNRILLIYEEAIRRFEASSDLDLRWLSEAAGIIRKFIEEYHEKLEEDHLFPRFRKAGRFVELVTILHTQHEAGRRLTAEILELANPGTSGDLEARTRLIRPLKGFVRLYRPHEAREDTVLFPALHELLSAREYDALGEDFEKKEHELLGKNGFDGMVEKTAEIEKALELYDLRQFTP